MYTTIHTHTSARAGALTRRHASGRARVKPTRAKPHACKVYVYVLAMRSASVHTPTQTHTHTRAHNDALAQSRDSTYMLVPVTAAVPPLHARTYYTHVPLAKTVALAPQHTRIINERTYTRTHTRSRAQALTMYSRVVVGRSCGAVRRVARRVQRIRV